MQKTLPAVMLVIGVGLVMFGFSDYVPGGSEVAGWSESLSLRDDSWGNARHHRAAAVLGRNGGVYDTR